MQQCSCRAFEQQTSELRLINSMYPDQLTLSDPSLMELLDGDCDEIDAQTCHMHPLQCCFHLPSKCIEIHFTLPENYPENEKLRVHIRLLDTRLTANRSKQLQTAINAQISSYIADHSQVDLLTVIQRVDELELTLEEALGTVNSNSTAPTTVNDENDEKAGITRIWIFSHHIYSTTKRREILDNARDLNLNGFCRSGKPGELKTYSYAHYNQEYLGFICVEGSRKDCEKFWQTMRSWNWQKITVIEQEDQVEETLFTNFNEIVYDNSAFIKYLEERKCSQIIKEYLGFL